MQPFEEAELEAIDATLAGEAVDPVHAELAELALLLAGERPRMREDYARALDARVARRFEPEPPPVGGGSRRARWRSRLVLAPASGLVVAAVLAVVVVAGTGGSPQPVVNGTAHSGAGASSPSVASGALQNPLSTAHARTPLPNTRAKSAPAATTPGSSGATYGAASGAPSLAPAPVPNGRRQIASGNLQLTAPGAHIDDVAQELFNVVGQENGIVRSSNITASSVNGYAYFSLQIPSGNLAETLGRLSTLRYAHVVSRTDSTQDVNDEYQADVRRLTDARALRTSLLKQLANATTAEQVASLTAQIHDAEASIASDEATLRGLQHRIDYSSLTVQVNAMPLPLPASHANTSTGGFTLGRAAHDALRVLTVAAGVALIVLAGLIPVGLLVALGLWIAHWNRRRRREQALDAA